MEGFIMTYWPQLLAFVALVLALGKMRSEIDTLKEKVKTLFDLWNNRK